MADRPIKVALSGDGIAVDVVKYSIDRIIVTSDQAVEFGKLHVIEAENINLTIPSGAIVGDTFSIKANYFGSTNPVFKINLTAGQDIYFGNPATAHATSSVASTDAYDYVTFMCIDSVNQWWSPVEQSCYLRIDDGANYWDGENIVQFNNGQLLIGKSGAKPVSGQLTSVDGSVLISPTGNDIDLSTAFSSLEPISITSGTGIIGEVGKKYIIDGLADYVVTLPAVSNVGDRIGIESRNGRYIVEQNIGNQIQFQGGQITTLGLTGFIKAEDTNATIILTCLTDNAIWGVESQTGNFRIDGLSPPAVLVSPGGLTPNDDLEILAGQSGSVPKNKTLTSTGGSITITTTPTSINFEDTGASTTITPVNDDVQATFAASNYDISIGLDSGDADSLRINGGNLAGTNGTAQTAYGYNSANFNSGTQITAVGAYSASSNCADNNTFVGYSSGNSSPQTGSTGVGHRALESNAGANTVALGYQAGVQGLGNNSVAVGSRAAWDLSSGTGVVIVGSDAGMGTITANNSILFGYQCNSTTTAGRVCFGNNMETPTAISATSPESPAALINLEWNGTHYRLPVLSSTATDLDSGGITSVAAASENVQVTTVGTDVTVDAGASSDASNIVFNNHSGAGAPTYGNNSVVVGQGIPTSSGTNNVLIGQNSSNPGNNNCTIIGNSATTRQGFGVSIGYQANSGGLYSTVVGARAGTNGSQGNNVVMGYQAGNNLTNCQDSVLIGRQCAQSASINDGATLIGDRCCQTGAVQQYEVCIGKDCASSGVVGRLSFGSHMEALHGSFAMPNGGVPENYLKIRHNGTLIYIPCFVTTPT